MTGFNMSEWVARPPKEVFDFISASENAPKIVQSVTNMVKLTEGPPRVGTRYRETRLMSGRNNKLSWKSSNSSRPRNMPCKM